MYKNYFIYCTLYGTIKGNQLPKKEEKLFSNCNNATIFCNFSKFLQANFQYKRRNNFEKQKKNFLESKEPRMRGKNLNKKKTFPRI